MESDRSEFLEVLDKFQAEFENGSDKWFDYFAEDASIYAIGEVDPISGRKAYQANFAELLAKSREVTVLKRDVHDMGDTAVAMHLLEVTQDDVVTTLRESTIWKRGDEGWRIIHLDTSQAADPIPAPGMVASLREDPANIKVLRSRLATTSVQVGVAQ